MVCIFNLHEQLLLCRTLSLFFLRNNNEVCSHTHTMYNARRSLIVILHSYLLTRSSKLVDERRLRFPLLWLEHILFEVDEESLETVINVRGEQDEEAEICEAELLLLLLVFVMERITSSIPTLTMVLADDDGHEAPPIDDVFVAKGDSDDEDVQYSKLYEAPLLLEEAWDLWLLLLLLCWLLVLLLLRLKDIRKQKRNWIKYEI